MKIVVDMQGTQSDSRFRGIGRYSLAFAKALIRNKANHDIVLLFSDLFPEAIEQAKVTLGENLGACTIKVWSGVGPTSFLTNKNQWRRLVSELLREAYIARLEPDILIVSSLVEGGIDDAIVSVGKLTNVFTVPILYDLIPWIYKSEYLPHPPSLAWYQDRMQELKKANYWLAISESSKLEGIKYLSLPSHSVCNISAAIGEEFAPQLLSDELKQQILNKFQIAKPFLMYSGAFDPRKNVERLISAFDALAPRLKNEHQLVLAGGINPSQRQKITQHLAKTGLTEADVIFTGRVSDEDFAALYGLCKAYILPTYHEGFGLTALEAMACGAPVIGSSSSSVPEVIGLDKALFDPFSVPDMADKITSVLSDEDYRNELIRHAAQQVKSFSWDQTAQRALAALEESVVQEQIQNYRAKTDLHELGLKLIKRLVEVSAQYEPNDVELKLTAILAAQLQCDLDPRPRLFIDISELHQRDSKSGIQRVVRSVIQCLSKVERSSHRVELVYALMDQPYRIANNYQSKLSGLSIDEGVMDPLMEAREGDVFLGLDLQDTVVIGHEDYYDYLRELGVKVYFVVYDLLPILLKNTFTPEFVQNYTQWLRIVCNQDGAVCISKAVAAELSVWVAEHSPARAGILKIDWFHLGAVIEDSIPTRGMPRNGADALEKIAASNTFLTVGTMEPRKCHAQIIDAFDLLWATGAEVSLVVVGKHGWMTERLGTRLTGNEKYGSSLFWYEIASDEFLEKIYQASTCLIAASQAEGFGLPLIEAAQYGLPIIARDIPVFREVAHDGAFYFKGDKAQDLANAITTWLQLNNAGIVPNSTTVKWQTWRRSTEQLISRLIPEFMPQ